MTTILKCLSATGSLLQRGLGDSYLVLNTKELGNLKRHGALAMQRKGEVLINALVKKIRGLSGGNTNTKSYRLVAQVILIL